MRCRQIETKPSRFRIGDIISGPMGMLLKVLTVQVGCPVWESNHHFTTAVFLENENNLEIPIQDMQGTYTVYRPVNDRMPGYRNYSIQATR